jgi:DNA-binding IclR family transcriptional regulator
MRQALSKSNPENVAPRKGVRSVEHSARLLLALIEGGEALPLKSVAAASRMSASTAHRYLASLTRVDFVRQDPVTGFYDLGPLAIRLGLAALSRFDFVERADQELRGLTQRLRIDGHVSIWGDYGPTIIRVRQANSPILTNLRLGRNLPLFASASGRIFLAFLPEEMTRAALDAEMARQTDVLEARQAVQRIIREVRQQGFAYTDGSVVPGLRAIAAPILDLQGGLCACVALVSPSESLVRFPNAMLDDLLATAQKTSRGLGWNPPKI